MDIRKLARLAYIELSPQEEILLQQGLQQAVHWMDSINDFCEAQPGTCEATLESAVPAQGESSSLSSVPLDAQDNALLGNAPLQAILVNAPCVRNHCFAVPKVIA